MVAVFSATTRGSPGPVGVSAWRSPKANNYHPMTCFSLRNETLVARTEAALRGLYAFADLDDCPAEHLLPDRGFSNENGKWEQALRKTLIGERA